MFFFYFRNIRQSKMRLADVHLLLQLSKLYLYIHWILNLNIKNYIKRKKQKKLKYNKTRLKSKPLVLSSFSLFYF